MKLWSTIFFLFATTAIINGQGLDEILEKHFEAVGMEYLKNVETIQYKGSYYNRYLEKLGNNPPEYLLKPEFVLTVAKGKGYRLHVFSPPGYSIIGFSEGNYWLNQNGNVNVNWNPGIPDRRIIQFQLDLEGFLYDWKRKAYNVIKMEDAILNDKIHHKIKLINKENNDTIYYYLDSKTFLISTISYDGDLSDGKEYEKIEFQKYKKVRNINISFKRIQTSLMLDGSYDKREIIIQEVILNPNIKEEIFISDYKNQ